MFEGMNLALWLGLFLAISEAMAFIPKMKSSGILDLIIRILKVLVDNVDKEVAASKTAPPTGPGPIGPLPDPK